MELEKIIEITSRILMLDPSKVSAKSRFVTDLQADSLDLYQIVMEIEEEFNVTISDKEAGEIITVGDAADKIKKALS